LVLLAIEVAGSSIHCDNEFRVRGKRALEKTVVGFVPDDTELGQRIAHREALDNFSDELWMIAEDVRVLFQDRRCCPCLNQTGARELVDEWPKSYCRPGRSRASECRYQGRLAR
jgi:hypothetical protein